MPCAISITRVVGFPTSSGTSVRVEGTATECTSIIVSVGCSAPAPSSQTVNVNPGNWIAQFPQPLDCHCNGQVHVDAQCATDPSCAATPYNGVLACGDDCPTVNNLSAQVGACQPYGTVQVTVSADVTP